MTVVGTLISDLILVWIDPRIRFAGQPMSRSARRSRRRAAGRRRDGRGRGACRTSRRRWQLIWWRFRKHQLAVAAGIVLLCFYLAALLAPFLATSRAHQGARRSAR